MSAVTNKKYNVSDFEFPPPDYPMAIGGAYNSFKDDSDGYGDMKSFICFDAGFRAALEFVEQKLTAYNSKSTQGCVICGCNISLKGYCAGCQTRVD